MQFYRSLTIVLGVLFSSAVVLASDSEFADSEIVVDTVWPAVTEKVLSTEAPSNNPVLVAGISNAIAKDTVKDHSRLVSDSKKTIMHVKNDNEIALPQVPDFNPLLTIIQLYDPMAYRVWPRPPRVIEEDRVLDSLRIDPLFMPLVFNAFKPDFRLKREEAPASENMFMPLTVDSFIRSCQSLLYTGQHTKRLLLQLESANIGQIKYDIKNMPEPERMVFLLENDEPPTLERPRVYLPGKTDQTTGILPRIAYNPWSTKGNGKLHFTETYISPNWSSGGESNMAGLATIYLEANYNDLKNVQFDNNLEIKVGLNTVSSDSLRNLNISTDQIRAVSKLGIKMYNNWYYSLSAEFLTQMLNNYETNTMELQSSFLSPAKLYISLGVDFKKADNKKGYNLSVLLSPLTYKLNYLYDNVNLSTSSYGIGDGKHFGSEIGSKVSSVLSWKFSERVSWNSKINYFTDYTYVDSEWENTFDVTLNHYFSTQVFVHLKLDDRLERDPGESLLQVQQLLSFGLTYRW